MTTTFTMKVRYGGKLPFGSVVIPEFDDDGVMTGKASLVTPERLKEIDPPVWFVVGLDGYHVRYRGAE
jgi:hypothetical protein